MSLKVPHPLWTSCGENSFEISKAIIQAKFLSGRYRTDSLLCHFGKNDTPVCSLCQESVEGSVEHLLVLCDKLKQCRENQFKMLDERKDISDVSRKLIYDSFKKSVSNFVQVLVDCSSLPTIINATQGNGNSHILTEIFKISRTWCFNIHMHRMKLLGRWRPS